MRDMKSYIDIEQSKKLAEILPLESADMCWVTDEIEPLWGVVKSEPDDNFEVIPSWSLATLLFEVLPYEISTGENFVDKYQIDIRKHNGKDGIAWYQIAYGNDQGLSGEWHDMINTGEKDNIIDCCYEMILKLKEKDLL